MIRLSGSVKLYWSLLRGPSRGGCGARPLGFLPAACCSSRRCCFSAKAAISSRCRSLARASISAVAARSFSIRCCRRATSAGTVNPSSSGVLSASSAFLQKLRDLLFEQRHLRARVPVAHGAVLARVGEDLGAIERERHIADPQHPDARRALDHLVKAARQQLPVPAAKGADRIVIGMMIRAEQPHRHLLIGVLLDAPAAEGARGVTVDEQPQHQRRRELLAAAAAARPPAGLPIPLLLLGG